MKNSILFKMTAWTDKGLVRENNEDNFLGCTDLSINKWVIPEEDTELTLSDDGCLLAVADGMGGMNAGEVASKIAVETVEEMFQSDKLPDDDTKIEAYLKSVVKEADKRIKDKGKKDEQFMDMGTTLVLVWVHHGIAHVAWCGDSRAYIYHSEYGLKHLSKDHSYVQELVDSGQLLPEYAFDHPDSNIITRSLGDSRKAAEADYLSYPLHNGEMLLLCSDGLCGMIRDKEIESIISENGKDLKACRNALIKEALNAGGYDNVTVALCQFIKGLPTLDDEKNPLPTTVKSLSSKMTKGKFQKIAPYLAAFFVIGIICCGLFFNKKIDIGMFKSTGGQADSSYVNTDSVNCSTPQKNTNPNDDPEKNKQQKKEGKKDQNKGQQEDSLKEQHNEQQSKPEPEPNDTLKLVKATN